MPAYEVTNPDGSVSIKVDDQTTLGPFPTRGEAMRASLKVLLERSPEFSSTYTRFLALDDLSPRGTLLPPEAA